MSSLSQLLQQSIATNDLNMSAAAQKIGVSQPSLRGVLKGTSVPNARSSGKYAAFLGISSEEFANLLAEGKAEARASSGKKGRGGRKASGRRMAPRGRGRGAAAGSAKAMLSELGSLVSAADKILSDDLAMAVHRLGKRGRARIEVLLRS